jgi:hypothetical protein
MTNRFNLWVFILLAGLAVDAMAEETAPKEEAASGSLQRFNKAYQAYLYGRYERALADFELAADQATSPELLGRIYLHIGLTQTILKETVKAERALRWAVIYQPKLQLDPAKYKPVIVKTVERLVAEAATRVKVDADTHGASIYLQGKLLGSVPLQIQLAPGAYRIEVQDPSGHLRAQHVVIDKEREIALRFRFNEKAAARTRQVNPARTSGSTSATTLTATPTTADSTRSGRLWTWVALGGAVAAAATGVGLYVSASGDASDYRAGLSTAPTATSEQRQALTDLRDGSHQKAVAANIVGFGVGGLLAVTATVLFFLEGKGAEKEAKTRRSWWVAPFRRANAGMAFGTKF